MEAAYLIGAFMGALVLFALMDHLHSRWARRQSEREARALMRSMPPRPMPAHPAPPQDAIDSHIALPPPHAAGPSGVKPRHEVIDCAGSSPCSTCPDKRECGKAGCVRIAARRGNADAGSAGNAGAREDCNA